MKREAKEARSYKEHFQLCNNYFFLDLLKVYCSSTPSFFYLIYISFLISPFRSTSFSPFVPKGIRKTHLLSTTPLYNTYRWLILPYHLPIRPASPFVFIFMAPLPRLNDSRSFIRKLSPWGNERTSEGRQAELLCTTCFTCKASGGLQSIIMISSPVGAEGRDMRARTWYGLS